MEEQLKNTDEDRLYRTLFYGQKENVIKCVNIDYESARKESFTCLQLHLQESNTIEEALRSLFTAEELTGDNAYEHETQGKQDAKKFMRIKKLPHVLQININRFGVSPSGEMIKIHSTCEFGDSLDFDKILQNTDSYLLSQPASSHNAHSQPSSSQQSHPSKPPTLPQWQQPQQGHQPAQHSNLYELHAILCHSGTLNRGHYFSYIRVGGGGQDERENPEAGSALADGEADAEGKYEWPDSVGVERGFDDGTWVKFNDQVVVPAFKHVAIGAG